MKISFYCWLPRFGFSGGRYLALCLANALADANVHVDFYTNEINCYMAKTCFTKSKVNFKKINTQKDKYDFGIIIPNGPGSTDFYDLFLNRALKFNYKNIFYNFESGNWWNFQSPYKKDIKLWKPWQDIAKKCNTILSISKTGDSWAREFYECKDFIYEPGPINVVYEKNTCVKKKQVLILTRIGNTSQHKGWSQIHLLNSKVLSGYNIIINTGNAPIPDRLKNNMIKDFSKNNIKLKFLTSITEEQKKIILKESSFLFFATEFEGLGMPPLESISLGTNVLCSDIPVLRETGENYYCFFNNSNKDIESEIYKVLNKTLEQDEIIKFNERYNMKNISKSLKEKLNERKKKMKIGIIGLGIVGTAVKEGMKFLNHEVTIHDLKLKTKIEQVLKTQIIFVCVPTPTKDSGACDTSVVESVVSELITLEYSGVIAIKSTVSIGTTQKLIHKYSNEKICFVPEFLRERCAIEDFIENHDLCVVGTENNTVFDLVNEAHGKLPQKISMATPSEAEAIKYFNNVYNATLITFANSFRDICVHKNVDYDNVKKQAVKRKHINDVYLNSNNDLRGFSGPCLPKDTKEIAKVSEETNITFFKDILKQNSKFKKTVLEGMRDE